MSLEAGADENEVTLLDKQSQDQDYGLPAQREAGQHRGADQTADQRAGAQEEAVNPNAGTQKEVDADQATDRQLALKAAAAANTATAERAEASEEEIVPAIPGPEAPRRGCSS